MLPKSVHEERIANNLLLEGIKLSEEDIKAIGELGTDHTMKVCWDSKDVV